MANIEPQMARAKTLSNLNRGKPGPKSRFVTTEQLLNAFENKFGQPFADFQMGVFHDYWSKHEDPECSKDDKRLFMQMFLYFSNKLTQNAPQTYEVEDLKKMSTDDLRAQAVEVAKRLIEDERLAA